jgi:hypothetical protein
MNLKDNLLQKNTKKVCFIHLLYFSSHNHFHANPKTLEYKVCDEEYLFSVAVSLT